MREILFRGKREDNGDWVYGSFIPDLCEVYYGDKLNGFIKPFGKTKEERLMVKVDRKTVGQYTESTDKNGTMIFENGYMIIDNKTYKVIFDNAEYILTNIFNCDIITLKNNSIKGVFADEI